VRSESKILNITVALHTKKDEDNEDITDVMENDLVDSIEDTRKSDNGQRGF